MIIICNKDNIKDNAIHAGHDTHPKTLQLILISE